MANVAPEQTFRRKFPRRKFRRKTGVLVAGKYSLIDGHEIGEGGLAFVGAGAWEVGQFVIVNFHIPHGDYISVRAEIRNKREQDGRFIYGCAFLNLKFEAKREIRTFVTARTAREN